MVFSSHQSLLPVTSMVKSAVMLWDQFWFGVFCVCECLQWRLLRLARIWRESVFEPTRVIADATATFTNLCVHVHSYVRVLLQKNCGVITSQLSMLAPCVCVLGQFWERRGGCGVREGWGGGMGAVHFSPFKLNVTQTTPLAHAHTQAHTLFFLQRIWQKKTFSICQNVCEFLKRKHREMEREVVTHRTHKKSTQSSQSDAVSRRVKGSLVWLPEELPLNWTVCVCVCVSRPARQTY